MNYNIFQIYHDKVITFTENEICSLQKLWLKMMNL